MTLELSLGLQRTQTSLCESGNVPESLLGGLGKRRLASAGDAGNEHDLVAVLEGVGFPAEEADVLVIDIDVDEAAELSGLVLDLGGEGREVLVDVGNQGGQILGLAGELFLAFSVADEGRREDDFDGDGGCSSRQW
jgi:hypothetical protein